MLAKSSKWTLDLTIKMSFALFFLLSTITLVHAQLKVVGKELRDRRGDRVVIRGIENGFGISLSEDGHYIDEIAKTGANAIRILPNLHPNQLTLAQVENLMRKAKDYGMVIYVSPNFPADYGASFNDALWSWLEKDEVYAMLAKFKDHLVIDGIQEQNYNDQELWVKNCKLAIDRIRKRGYTSPICVIPNNFGRDHTAIINKAGEVLKHDPLRNIIFNVQAYWDQNWDGPKKYSTTLLTENITALAKLPYHIQIGICPWAEGGPCDDANVDFKTAMALCEQFQIGWLVWEWYNPFEWSHVFSLSTTGTFGSWSDHCTWEIVDDCRDNGKYGCDYGYQVAIGHPASIKNTSKKTCLLAGKCNVK